MSFKTLKSIFIQFLKSLHKHFGSFSAASLEEIMKNIRAARYPPIPSTYSKTLSDLIRVMLKVDPKSRPTAYQLATCEALADDLGTIHILRKHLYSTKLNLTTYFFHKNWIFSGKTKEFIFQHYIFDEIFIL